MQIPKMQEVSFMDELLPCLIWMSALYLRAGNRIATDTILEFIKDAEAGIKGVS